MKPWYMYPEIQCRVLNKIANRINYSNLELLKATMDHCTEVIWSKVDQYYKTH